ncbi:MAG: fructose-bisphosphate aldolase, class I [Parcubacteria bacterium C7867-004]|nr:MAG: fructose-bisphosphate aldolase, class I [Parcubacteria bacterium C7867-004]
MQDLQDIARAIMAPGKGLLAADESNESADQKRLEAFGIATGEEMRREFRDLFLATPGIEEYLSGVILYKETLGQMDDKDGIPSKEVDHLLFPKLLSERGIMPGIKVDDGLDPMPDSPNETITKGLIGLSERLTEYRTTYGTTFTKWRAAIRIDGDRLPTSAALVENAKRLASYASEAQKAGMVPLLEPEVLLEGKHSRLRSRDVIETTLHALFDACRDQAVDLSSVILKTSMALSGKDTGRIDSPEDVAEDTLGALLNAVPKEVPGIVFLSGGQTPDQATDNLRAIARLAKEKNAPWPLTFSYARAFQEEALQIWMGKPENVPSAREAFINRLETVSKASLGQ